MYSQPEKNGAALTQDSVNDLIKDIMTDGWQSNSCKLCSVFVLENVELSALSVACVHFLYPPWAVMVHLTPYYAFANAVLYICSDGEMGSDLWLTYGANCSL